MQLLDQKAQQSDARPLLDQLNVHTLERNIPQQFNPERRIQETKLDLLNEEVACKMNMTIWDLVCQIQYHSMHQVIFWPCDT